ncbi:MAG: AMP-binding protein [Ectothiorhodospiraceae bacterium]|nr:AMP-binding protein [Ectothiorhodospiraceae bacterium]
MYLTYGLNRWSAQTPERTALICEDRETSYGELRDRVARLAGCLERWGAAPGDRVAILSLNSDRAIEMMLAAFWGARVANNLNIRWSPGEIVYGINDSGATVLAIDKAFSPHLPVLRESCPGLKTVVYLSDGDVPEGAVSMEAELREAEPVPEQNTDPQAMAILNYTGGTTGRSKGVMWSHAAFTHASAVTLGDGFWKEGVRACLATPLFHVTGLSVVLMNMALGNPVVVLPLFDPDKALQLFQDRKVGLTVLVPTMLQMLIHHPEFDRYDLSALKYVRYGGSPIAEPLLRRFMEKLPHTHLAQVYGQTEMMPLTILRDEDHTPDGLKRGVTRSAGRASPYVELYAVDAEGNRLPPGEPGEIVARALNGMLGYWNKPEATAEALVNGVLHTGDIGYLDREGYLYLVDRKKDMIVTGGENVYSTEVESVLAGHPAVQACAVVARPDETWGEAVHACVVLQPGETVEPEALQAYCREHIAGYKIPRSVTFMDELPLSGPGKVNKVALRELVRNGGSSA